MHARPVAVALLVALAPGVLPLAAMAQPAGAEDPTTAMARSRFKEGVEFYDKSEYEQARASFLQAYALKKHPAVLLNLAWSCLKSGHALEADKYFKQFLTEGKDVTDKQRTDANDGLTQAHTKLGRIEVAAAAGTEVTIDGDRAGTTPLPDAIVVEPGAHTVKFKAVDGTMDTQSVSVLGGEKAVARLTKTGGASVSPTPAPAPPPEPTTTEPAPKPPEPAPPKAPEPKPAPPPPVERHKGGPLAPPSNVVPAAILGAVGVGAFVAAGIMLGQKSQAQNKANEVATTIREHTPAGMSSQGICNNPPSMPTGLAQACSDFVADNNDVNQDATVGNVLVGVGVAALVGAGVYWLLASKPGDEGSAASSWSVEITPVVARTQTGLSISGSF